MLIALVVLFAVLVLLVFGSIAFYGYSYKILLDYISDSDYNELFKGDKYVG